MKNKNKIIGWGIIVIIIALIIGVPILSQNNTIFTKINYNQLTKMVKNEEFTFVYIGYEDCQYCQNMMSTLADIYKKYDEKIYYLDYSKLTEAENKALKSLDNRLSTMGTPTFLFIKDGEIVGVKIGASATGNSFEEIYLSYYEDPVYYTTITADEFIQKYNSDSTNVLVIGQTMCGHCTNYKPIISTVAQEQNIEIYYLEYDLLSNNDKTKIAKLNKKFESFGTPYTLVTKKGKILDEITTGYVEKEVLLNFLKENKIVK